MLQWRPVSHQPSAEPDRAAGRHEPPWREPVRGGYPDPRYFGRSGADQLQALLAGEVPQPPISRLTGMRLVDVDAGSAAFAIPLSDWLCSPQAAISIGPLTIPADAAVACAIQTELPPATPFTTSELSLRLLAPVAHGISLCFVAPQVSPGLPATTAHANSAPVPTEPRSGGSGTDDPDPYARPAQGEVLRQEVWQRLSGLEVLLAQLTGELPMPPVHYLTGLTLTAAAPGEATFTMPASEWLCAPPRARVQGGAVALLAETALSSAIQAQLPAATALAPVDLKVNYLRPLAADGRLALARGRVIHAGRRIAVANAEVLDADGKPVAVATGSAMILPGREASLGATES